MTDQPPGGFVRPFAVGTDQVVDATGRVVLWKAGAVPVLVHAFRMAPDMKLWLARKTTGVDRTNIAAVCAALNDEG